MTDTHPHRMAMVAIDGEGIMRHHIERYLRDRHRMDGLTKSTMKDLRSRLATFADLWPNLTIGRVSRRHIIRWLDHTEHLAPSTRRSYFSTLRVFFSWAVDERIIDRDPTRGLRTPKVPEGVPKRLRRDEVVALVTVAADDLRTLLIVLLMLQEGLRRSEVAALLISDIDPAERVMLIRGKGGRGVHTATLPITDETWSVMSQYRAELRHHHGPLIRSKNDPNLGISGGRVGAIVTEAMIEAGVKIPGDPSRTCHSTRHTTAHDLLAKTDDIRAVQQALRHRTVTSTEIYLRGHVSDLRPVMEGRRYLDAA